MKAAIKCLNCCYRDHVSQCCTYLLKTGHPRGCVGGRECIKFEPDEKIKRQLGIGVENGQHI